MSGKFLGNCKCMIIMLLLSVVGVWNTSMIAKAQWASMAFLDGNPQDVTLDGIYLSEDGTYEIGYQYINSKEVKIVGFKIKNENTSVVIPSEIGGKKVTRIGHPKEIPNIANVGMLQGCDDITGIKFPYTLTGIDKRTFLYCSNLETVDIPASVSTIGEYAFTGTKWMENKQNESPFVIVNNILIDGSSCTGEITIPSGVKSIAAHAFSTLKKTPTISPNGDEIYIYNAVCSSVTEVACNAELKAIGDYAFLGCNSLTAVTFNYGLETIGQQAFLNCSNLDSVSLPTGIKNVGYWAFDGTKFYNNIAADNGLKISDGVLLDGTGASGSVVIPDAVKVIADSAFYSNTESKAYNELTAITIPGTVEKIPESAVASCKNLKIVTIEEGVKSIENHAFSGCSTLETVSIPSSVTSIGNYAFSGCSQLETVSFPSSVTSIGIDAFKGTKWLDDQKSENEQVVANGILIDAKNCSGDVVIPDTITSINSDAFKGNTAITSLTIPDKTVVRIDTMFSGCTGLQSINLPESVTEISYGAFSDCTSLTAINVAEDNTSYSSKDGILYDKNEKELITYPAAKGEVYTMPETVTTVAARAFDNCDNLEEIILPSKLEIVSSYAFGNDYSEVGDDERTKVTVPEEMDVSGVGLENIKATNRVIIYVAEGSSADLYLEEFKLQITVVTYPSKNGNKEDEKKEEDKKDTSTDASASGGTETGNKQETVQTAEIGKTYEVGNATYKVTSDTEVTFTAPKSKSVSKITVPASVTIMNKSYNVTSVAKGACKGCKKLTTATVGKNVKSIGDEAFMNCTKLNKMTVGKNVISIGKKTFSGDKKLKKLIFKGAKISKVGKKALSGVPKKVKISAPKKAVSKYKKLLNKAK